MSIYFFSHGAPTNTDEWLGNATEHPTSYLFSSRAAVESAERLGGLNVRHSAARNSVGHRNGRKLFQSPYRATSSFPDSGPSPQVKSDGVTREG